ncbi:hypothetical protein BHM03_00024882 [Ensete ventricosum]|uniref:Uncharacterized protein n=1 Tax=Ensete ventricosum TaxID=4639 RepID=A0A445MGU2_ENSVE|nr:hypothetical protein BHM03_00024882 [Ensete ventricosum]
MARPPARGRPTTAKAPLQRGDRLQPGPLQGSAAHMGSNRLWARPTAGSSQGPTARGQPCHLCRGSDGGGAEGAKSGLGHPFKKRMILPL